MNDTIQSILNRRSIRGYEPTPVAEEDIVILLACGQLAPTGMGRQAWHFSAVTSRAVLDEIGESCRSAMAASEDEHVRALARSGYDPFRGAPCVIFLSGDGTEWAEADCANATATMAIAAQSMGLSSCYLAGFRDGLRDPAIRKKVGVPEGYEPLFALAVGYGSREPKPREPRKAGAVNYVR